MPTPKFMLKNEIQLIDHDGVENVLKSFNRRTLMREMTVLQRQNAKYMLRIFKLAFKKQADPSTNRRWEPLSPMTLRRREFKGRPILTQTGKLRRSLDYKVIPVRGRVNALIGTQHPPALVHQLGKNPNISKIGNQRILYRPIPARPFIGFNKKQEDRVGKNVVHFLKAKVRPRGSGTRLSSSKLPFTGMGKSSGLTGRWGMRS